MPLLRLKPFKPELPPKHLTADDEVFLCDLTGEVFTSYEAFYQRMILCNSLVWSCEISGKPNQTFKEAEESEKSIRKSLSAIPFSLKLAILYCVHHTRRSKIQDLTDEIYEYLKTRYQLDEKVEVKIKDKWTESIVSEIPYSVDLSLQNKLNCQKSALLNSGDEKLKAFNSILGSLKSKSPLENKELRTDTSELSYKVLVLNGPKKSETIVLKGKSIRRAKKGVFAKDKVKLFLKQSCRRTTTSSDDGYWVVEKKEVSKYGLGLSCIKPVTILSNKNKKPKTVKSFMDRPQDIALQQQKIEQKRIEMEQERERKKTELDALREQKLKEKEEEKALREQKLKEKEEEKARKKDEREKERELNLERKNLELDFVREFNKVREDLLLEDSKPLPSLAALESNLDKDLIGDSIMVVEFVNTFGSLLGFEQEFDGKVTLSWLEEALSEHDAEGNYFSIVKFLLHSYLCIDKEENNYKSDDDDDGSSSDNSTTPAQSNTQSNAPDFNDASKKASANASAAAAWSVLHQGMSLSDIAIEPFSLTEILRLHILSSGVRIGGIIDYNQWQRRGQYQLSDDPCVWFRHQEKYIMEKIMTSSVYDLSPAEKLKILVLLCNQTLMLSTVREYMEDSFDKMKSLRKDLREVQLEENQRRRKLQQAKWKKKVEERKKLKEEIKLKKERKSLEAQQQIQLQNENPGTPGVNVNAVDSPRSDGTLTPVLKTEASPNIQENGNGKEIDGLTDPKEQQEKELERKRKKEEKEQQIDDFHHEKFLFREKEILNEIAKYSAVISETPIGSDRFCRRYWNFHYVDGLLVENDEEAMFIASESDSDDSETENEGGNEMSEDEEVKIIEKEDNIPKKPPRIPKVTFEDIMKAKNEGIPLTRLILNRYNCSYNERSEEIVQKSPALKPLITNIVNGIDPRSHKKAEDKWYHVCSKEEYEAVVDSLNIRGIRENILNSGLLSAKTEIINSFEETSKLANKKLKNMNLKSEDGNDIDKSLFETMDDYIEGNLRDSLLEIEERLWLGNIGIIKCEDRLNWRTSIEQGMMKLIKYESPKKDTNAVSCGNDSNAEKSDTDVCVENGTDSSVENNDTQEMASPSHLKTEVKNDISSCVSQISIPNSERQLAVKELADALLLIERGIEKRFLKAPLGEAEEIKVGKIKKVIESSNENQEDKKGSQCLSRWEESLGKCTSFAQIFIHLDTLDRSILWDKSIQNTKCRLCRRKGNEDEMLLCDGCDRGFHMSCLRPKLKTVPEGDWFCPDCRPIEIKRRNRKVSVQEEETEEEESDDETEEEDASSQSDSQSDGDEEEEDDEDDDSVNASEHGEHCTVCNEEGTLILCDECPRSYHIGCCYPRLKKVPRGNWCCQICTGLDLELPYKKRAITCERRKVRELKALNQTKKPQNRKARKQQQRGQADSKVKLTKDKKRNSSPIVNIKAAKKAKQDNDSSPLTTQRSSGMNRFHLKNCSALIGEVFELEEAQDFLVPVDSREVPDYYDFIDMPMDFGTIKRKLNTAKYVEIQEFLDDVNLVFQNCQTYNPPRSHVSRDGAKLKKFVTKRLEELGLS